MRLEHIEPHPPTDGCTCDCVYCVTLTREVGEGHVRYRRVCICQDCSSDCSGFRGPEGTTELGSVDAFIRMDSLEIEVALRIPPPRHGVWMCVWYGGLSG